MGPVEYDKPCRFYAFFFRLDYDLNLLRTCVLSLLGLSRTFNFIVTKVPWFLMMIFSHLNSLYLYLHHLRRCTRLLMMLVLEFWPLVAAADALSFIILNPVLLCLSLHWTVRAKYMCSRVEMHLSFSYRRLFLT
jgi:hypothetical protein